MFEQNVCVRDEGGILLFVGRVFWSFLAVREVGITFFGLFCKFSKKVLTNQSVCGKI